MLGKLLLISTLLLSLVSLAAQEISSTWDHQIEVQHGPEEFSNESLYAYSTIVYEISSGDVKRLILEEVKEVTSEKTTKKAIKQGIRVHFAKFDADDIAVKVKTEDVHKTDAVRVVVAFLKGEDTVNPKDYPAAHDAAQSVMHEMGVRLNRSVVESQLTEQKDELEDLEKKRRSLTVDLDDLEEDVIDARTDMLKLKEDNIKLEEKLSKAKANEASLEVFSKTSTATAKDMKKYSKAQSKASKIESHVLKNNRKIVSLESDMVLSEQEQPLVEQQISEVSNAIEKQRAFVEALETKLGSID